MADAARRPAPSPWAAGPSASGLAFVTSGLTLGAAGDPPPSPGGVQLWQRFEDGQAAFFERGPVVASFFRCERLLHPTQVMTHDLAREWLRGRERERAAVWGRAGRVMGARALLWLHSSGALLRPCYPCYL